MIDLKTIQAMGMENTVMEIRWRISRCDDCDDDHGGFDDQVSSSAHLSSEEDAWSCRFLYFPKCFLGCYPLAW